MKIIQTLPELNEGGVERGTIEFSRELVKLGHESWVISKGGKLVDKLISEGGKHLALDVCSKNPLTAFTRSRQLRKAFAQINPDVIHARSRVPAWLCRFANRPPKYPFVTTVHGLNSINRYSEVMVSGDRVIAVGEPIRDYVCKAYGKTPDDITIVKRGVDMDSFNPAKVDHEWIANFKQEYGLTDSKIITSVGRITKIKDYETFIDSIALLKGEFPNIKGLIVGGAHAGKEEYLESLKQRVADQGVTEHIIFAGSQTRMAEIYFMSDAIVNATLTMGNVGRTVIEGLAMDTPVLCTTMDGLDNVVTPDINGYLINVRDPENLSSNLRKTLSREWSGIRQTIPYGFTLTSMVETVISVYQQAIELKSSPNK